MSTYIDSANTLRRDLMVRPLDALRATRIVLQDRANVLMGSDDWLYADLSKVNKRLATEMVDYDAAIASVTQMMDYERYLSKLQGQIALHQLAPRIRFAAKAGRKKECSTLLQYGADVNAADSHGWTALHEAAAEGHTDVCALLLSRGATLGLEASNGLTAFQLAVRHNQCVVVDYLIKTHGERLDQVTSRGETLDTLAGRGSDCTAMLSYLMERRAEATASAVNAAIDASRSSEAPSEPETKRRSGSLSL